jgi:hypothetical protein
MTLLPTNLDGLRRLGASRTSESETGAEDNNSEDNERIGKTFG